MRHATKLLALGAGIVALSLSGASAQPGGKVLASSAPSVTTTPLSPMGVPLLITHGQLHTMGAAGNIANGDVLIQGRKIIAVGTNLPVPQGARVIDAHGKPVTPGLMASATQLGIQEIQLSVSESNDTFSNQAVDSAAFDVSDAVNSSSTLIPIARIAGVTRSLTVPIACGEVFCGTAAVLQLGDHGGAVIKTAAGVLADLEPTGGDNEKYRRPDLWAKFREALDDAREYWAQRAGYHRPGGSRDQRSSRIDLDALGPVISGKEPLIVHVDRSADIEKVVNYAAQNKLKVVILGGDEAWMAASLLASSHVPVIIDADHNLPVTFSSLGATLKNAARLDAAGVQVIFMPQDDDPAQYARTLTQIAGNAVANGMPWDHALAAITTNPAAVWGIADTYGTLEPGKDADVVVWDGDPLDVTSAPTAVFIAGQAVPLVSRQTMLRDRYRNLKDKKLPFAYR